MNAFQRFWRWYKPCALELHNPNEYTEHSGGPLVSHRYGYTVRANPLLWQQGITVHPQDLAWFVACAEHKLGCVVWNLSGDIASSTEGLMMSLSHWIELWNDPIILSFKHRQDPTLYTPKDAVKMLKNYEWYSAHPGRWKELEQRYAGVTYTEPMNRLHTYPMMSGDVLADFLFFIQVNTTKPVLLATSKPEMLPPECGYINVNVSSATGRFWVYRQKIMDHVTGVNWSII